ncbi:MAG: DUF4416 family protein [Thermovirga sp.]
MQPAVIRIIGILHPDEEWLQWSIDRLEAEWGNIRRRSETFPFSHTDYYCEIAPKLKRTFVSFPELERAGDLADWKVFSCSIEGKSGISRRVNIDPGYVNGSRLVLASTKDHAHRIFLRDGIFAEVTLRFMRKKWIAFDCTFPDFASGVYDNFLDKARKDWLEKTTSYGGAWID